MGFFNAIKNLFVGETKKSKKKVSSTPKKAPKLHVIQGEKKETPQSTTSRNAKDKQEIAAYQQKIAKMLQNDPHAQKRAADILSQMINKNNKSA